MVLTLLCVSLTTQLSVLEEVVLLAGRGFAYMTPHSQQCVVLHEWQQLDGSLTSSMVCTLHTRLLYLSLSLLINIITAVIAVLVFS